MKKQILSNLSSNYLLSFFGMTLGFFLVPFLIGKLGQDVYGIIVLTESTIAFFEIITVSVRMALSRHATFAYAQGRMQEFIEYLSTSLRILYVSAIFIAAVGTLISCYFPNMFKVPHGYGSQSQWHFFMISSAFALSVLNIVYWSGLYAKQRFDLINFSSSFGLVMRAVCIFLFYSLVPKQYISLTAYGFIYLTMTLAQNGMIVFWFRRILPDIRLDMKLFRADKVREILSFSAHSSLIRVSSLLYQNAANILINVFWGPSLNTVYSVALKLPQMMSRIFIEPSWALTPTFTELAGKNDMDKIRRLFFSFSMLSSILTFPMLLSLIFLSGPIIQAWVGPSLAPAARLMPLYVLPLFTIIPAASTGSIFNAYAKIRLPSLVTFGTAVLNIVLCLLFGVVMKMQLFGIGIAGAICTVSSSLIFFPLYACRMLGVPGSRYYVGSILKPLLLSAIFIGGGFYALKVFHPELKFGLALAGIFTALHLVYYGAAYLLLLGEGEKKHVDDALGMVLDAVKRTSVRDDA